ncbi:MAG: hypothetical protein ACPGUX_03850 [Halocynthiibacter sp.]
MKFVAVIVAFFATPAFAQEVRLTGDEIQELLPMIVVTGNQTWQNFDLNGDTRYDDARGPSHGWWEVRGNQYCSAWGSRAPSYWSCYQVWREGETLIWTDESGHRIENHIQNRQN